MSVSNTVPKGVAPIKPEFQITREKFQKPAAVPENAEKTSETESTQSNQTFSGSKTKKRRGMNKQRAKQPKPDFSKKLCPSVLYASRTCKFGEKCLFCHDKSLFWSRRPADLDGPCPNIENLGFCRYGVTCRFGASHTNPETLENVPSEPEKSDLSEKNCLSPDLQRSLRAKNYDFSTALEASKNAQKSETSEKTQVMGPELEERALRATDLLGKRFLAPLTTVGNLPFRRVCVGLGAEVTCSEMALATQLLQGQMAEWSLVRRHECEKYFGVQLCGSHGDLLAKAAMLMREHTKIDFLDMNVGCPIDLICGKGAGCSLMGRIGRLGEMVRAVSDVLEGTEIPLSVKMRAGLYQGKNIGHKVMDRIKGEGVSLFTLHPRSREQRYAKLADWSYVSECVAVASPIPIIGCGDVLSFEDYDRAFESGVGGVMIGRGALYKPWIFTEIQEKRHWDISSGERLDILKKFTSYGLEHWGSDTEGVEKTRKFLLEWLSFLHRYIPIGLLEVVPQKINQKPPPYMGRNDLETLMASDRSRDWIRISEMLLGNVPDDFVFIPKHRASAY